jgi:hypothetical protein
MDDGTRTIEAKGPNKNLLETRSSNLTANKWSTVAVD